MLRSVSEDKEAGGVVVGGISFGISDDTKVEVASGVEAGTTKIARATAPREQMGLLPLRVVAVADLMPRGEFNAGANAPDAAIRVDATDVDGLFKQLNPRASIQVDSVLLDGGRQRIEINPKNLKGFRPDGLVAEVPLLRSLLDGKKVLERLRDGTMDVSGATNELNRLWNGSGLVQKVLGGVEVKTSSAAAGPAPAPTPTNDGADVMRILDMVDSGTTSDADTVSGGPPTATATPPPAAPSTSSRASSAKGKLDAFISAIAKSGDKPGARPDEGIRTIEKAASLQLGAILQHPEIRRLEQAWRGVAFLMGRTPKEGVKLEVVAAGGDDAAPALQRAINAGGGMEPPVSFAIVDETISSDAASLARFRSIADVAEANTVPVFTNASPDLFCRGHLDDIDRLDNKAALFEAPDRSPWRKEANRTAAAWVVLSLNRVLARKAYDKRSARVREAAVEELPNDEQATVWMSPAWAIGTLPILSFDKTGWPCRVTGTREGGIIEDLPVHDVATGYDGSEKAAVPTEAFFSTETQRALGRIGLMALAAQPNSDSCYLLSASTAYVQPPKRTYDSDTTEPELRMPKAPLGDQLFVARLVQFLQHLGSQLPSTGAPSEVQQEIEGALHELFANARPPGPELTVNVDASESGLSAVLTIRPRNYLGVQMEELSLGVPLH